MNKQQIYFFVSAILSFLIITHFEKSNSENGSSDHDKFYPSDIELVKRTFPYYDYDKNAYKNAVIELKRLKLQKEIQKTSNEKINAELEFVGPTNIGGRIVDIEFNPITPNIVYAAAATGGVFKSIDNTETFV